VLRPILIVIQVRVPCKWANDTQHFLLEYFDIIHDSPSQIYHSALPFAPSLSWIHQHYHAKFLNEVKVVRGLPVEWGSCSRTVPFASIPCAISCWNNSIAAGLFGGDIVILDAITGSQAAVLSGHTGWVTVVMFSSHGVLLVSGSSDKTVKVWDVQTGGVVKTLHGHKDRDMSVSISTDSTMIFPGDYDGMIFLWNIKTWQGHHCSASSSGDVGF
jgi:WD40 repeat protein